MIIDVDDRDLAPNKRRGLKIEASVIEAFDALGTVPDHAREWHDAITVGLLAPSASLRFGGICVVERGTPVEIKGTQCWTSNGSKRTDPGRWYVKRHGHDQLVAHNGVYLLVVYSTPQDHLVRIVVPASILDEHLRDRWHDTDQAGVASRAAKLSWRTLLDERVVLGRGSA